MPSDSEAAVKADRHVDSSADMEELQEHTIKKVKELHEEPGGSVTSKVTVEETAKFSGG